jgi:4-amino-4-deoxy-L-arabinose transferase-like glycosyltransferase
MITGECIDRGFGRWLVAVAALGFLARLAASLDRGGLDDPDNYLVLARALVEGRGFAWDGRPTAYRPPLYPLVLAPLVAALGDGPALGRGIALLHAAFGAGTVLLTAAAARRWGLGPGRALVAAAIVALDPVLVAQGRMVMTETLTALLLAASLAALALDGRRGAALGGVALGLSALCRPSTLPAAALVAAAGLVVGPGSRADRLWRGALVALATVATLAPWALRNARIFGEPVWTTTHGGYTLALANNPTYYAEILDGPPGAVWSGPNQQRWFAGVGPSVAGLSEPAADRRLRSFALQLAWARPRDFARASLARLGRFWGIAPAGAVYPSWLRALTALWTVPLGIALVAGLCRRTLWTWPRIAAPLMLAALSAVHSVYWTDLRMRAPLIPAIALIVVSVDAPFVWLSRYARLTPGATGPGRQKKIQNSHRILLFKIWGNVSLKTAALGGNPLVSRVGR